MQYWAKHLCRPPSTRLQTWPREALNRLMQFNFKNVMDHIRSIYRYNICMQMHVLHGLIFPLVPKVGVEVIILAHNGKHGLHRGRLIFLICGWYKRRSKSLNCNIGHSQITYVMYWKASTSFLVGRLQANCAR